METHVEFALELLFAALIAAIYFMLIIGI